jgi:nucleoside-diphosphate-sugar epimerase
MNFIYVEDVVDALLSIAERPDVKSRIYNIGTPESINLADLAAMIIRASNSPSSLTIGALPPREYENYCPDTFLAKDQLGFVARTSLEKGMEECVRWALRDGREPSFKHVEFVESRI